MRATKQSDKIARFLRYTSLLALVIQTTTVVLLLRYSRTISVGPKYLSSSAVVVAEIIKILTCVLIIWKENPNPSTFIQTMISVCVSKDSLKLSIPAGLYAIQNNLLYIALSNLDAPPYQIVYQLKIIITALFSVVMLNKRFNTMKWVSMIMLMGGVALVQLSLDSDSDKSEEHKATHNSLLGVVAVLVSCLTSGFAGVYFEKILKGTAPSLWVRNIQLGVYGTIFGVIIMFINDADNLSRGGFFQGYDTIVWLVILVQAVGGLIIAMVVKYADNILKGFASAVSIVLSCVLSLYFFSFTPTRNFVIGATIVIIAVYLYSLPDKEPQTSTTKLQVDETQSSIQLKSVDV
eukprot:TRINITY_DN3715_c0_g4_i1.p1 TRINITY_DN3715_c0_g4~~TRINITY_DN3715_c0_g4_i1.p1  ORF type:complete len:349 (-),score=37.79 TRINITY_DN3715_c0_g4_i1:100-1146(-)